MPTAVGFESSTLNVSVPGYGMGEEKDFPSIRQQHFKGHSSLSIDSCIAHHPLDQVVSMRPEYGTSCQQPTTPFTFTSRFSARASFSLCAISSRELSLSPSPGPRLYLGKYLLHGIVAVLVAACK